MLKGSIASKHGMRQVTGRHIAYVAVQVGYLVSFFSCADFYHFRLVSHSHLSNRGMKRTPISTTRNSMLRLSTFLKRTRMMNSLLELSNTGISLFPLIIFFLCDC